MANLFKSLGDKLNEQAQSLSSAVKKAVAGAALPGSKNIVNSGEAPWSNQFDAFFPPLEIDGKRWDRIYPYRLLVIDVKNNNKIVGPGSGSADAIEYRTQVDGGNVIVQYQNKWEFRLPITPQQISFVSNYAINVTPTLRGMLEEHAGLRFKEISMQGTFGVWPTRPQFDKPAKETSIQTIFSGTINAIGRVAEQVRRTVRAFTGQNPFNTPTPAEPQNLIETGYYNARYLDQFLEQYAIAKKDPRNSGWRLVFDVPKNNETFVVTPISLNVYKNANKPMEEMFTLQLKAWKRINLDKTEAGLVPSIPGLDTNTFTSILEGIRQARVAAQESLNLIKAVRSDFQKPLNALREAALFVKDLGGVAQSAAELPRQIVKDYQSGLDQAIRDADEGLRNLGDGLIKTLTLGLVDASGKFEGRNISSTQKNSKALSQQIESDPAYNIFNDPESAFTLFEKVDMDSVALSDEQRLRFEEEVDRVRNYNIDDLRNIRETLYGLALDISNEFGVNDPVVNEILGRPTPKVRLTPLTVEENEFLVALMEAVTQMDILTATRNVDESRRVNPLQYVGDYAAENGVPFEAASTSKILVPVPFGKSLEEIALRYLGDANRWIEIATLNALREPYIDETGFQYPLLSNGDGRQVIVGSDENLFVGQKVTLFSSTVPAFNRKITAIERIGSSTNFLITVDGLPNLDSLTLAQDATLQAYMPGTVNSQDQIYVPTDLPAEPDDYARQVPGIEVTSIVGLSKIDLLLTEDFDVAINNQGDFRLAAGLTNLIQALKIKLFTERGSILTDPTFGIGIVPGRNVADIDVNNLLKDISGIVTKDPRFEAVDRLEINLNGPVLEISMRVILANRMGVVPITFVGKAPSEAA
jgi:hypothetical protein